MRPFEKFSLTTATEGDGEFLVVVDPAVAGVATVQVSLQAGRSSDAWDAHGGPHYAIERHPCTGDWRMITQFSRVKVGGEFVAMAGARTD